jgi:septum formation inhibitor MinC
MNQACPVALAVVDSDTCGPTRANVSLRGTTRGLEILIVAAPSAAALGARLAELLSEAPSFFAGSDARVAFEGALPVGALACLEDTATRFALRIVELGPAPVKRGRQYASVVRRDVRRGPLAEGSGPIAEQAADPDRQVAADHGDLGAIAGAARDAAPAGGPVVIDPSLPSDAAPIEIALANTAPYSALLVTATLPPGDAPVGAAAEPASPLVGAAGLAESALGRGDLSEPQLSPEAAAAIEAALACAVPVLTVAGATGLTALCVAASGDAPHVAAAAIEAAAATMAAAIAPGPRLVIGPVRSGVIVDHTGHVIVIGDVNPGAEVRAEGSIIVLGRLRGVAHAAIGRDAGCIVALSLAPQQLRIGRMVARAGDADRPGGGAEIAYVTGETIVVERFTGRLPSGLAASM